MYGMDRIVVTMQENGSYLVRMHQTNVNREILALTDEQMAALKDKLEKISGKTVTLTQKTDPTVLAGLKVELEGRQLDGTVKSRLDDLSRKLNELIV